MYFCKSNQLGMLDMPTLNGLTPLLFTPFSFPLLVMFGA